MDLGGWLRSPSLGRYEAAFRENEIDETVLPGLNADLKELGVAAVVFHRKLLDAIAALRGDRKTLSHLGHTERPCIRGAVVHGDCDVLSPVLTKREIETQSQGKIAPEP